MRTWTRSDKDSVYLFYRGKFRNVAEMLFESTWRKHRDIIIFLERTLKDPTACYSNFFRFLLVKVKEVGLDICKQVVDQHHVELVPYLQQHEASKPDAKKPRQKKKAKAVTVKTSRNNRRRVVG